MGDPRRKPSNEPHRTMRRKGSPMTKVLGISALAILLGITAANAKQVTTHHHPQSASPYIDQTWSDPSPSGPNVWGAHPYIDQTRPGPSPSGPSVWGAHPF
jgi:hypothetical protein